MSDPQPDSPRGDPVSGGEGTRLGNVQSERRVPHVFGRVVDWRERDGPRTDKPRHDVKQVVCVSGRRGQGYLHLIARSVVSQDVLRVSGCGHVEAYPARTSLGNWR